jgi:VWFA-related protein
MRTLFCCAAIALFALRLAAQTAPQVGPGSVLHANARLVVVDVTVTDSHGAPVHGLDKSVFHLAEAKHAQAISNFEEHSSVLDGDAAVKASLPPLTPGVFTNIPSVSSQSPVTILLFDRLNTPVNAQTWVRGKLLDYLRKAPPNARIAIFGLNSQLVMLQGLTTDPALLRAALDHERAQKSSTPNYDLEPDPKLQLQDPGPLIDAAVDAFDSTALNVNEDMRATTTLHAFNQLGRYLAGIPGRKNLIYFSAAFPLNLLPTQPSKDAAHPRMIATADIWSGDPVWKQEYRDTIDMFTRNQVAIYPIDPRGLLTANAIPDKRILDESHFAMLEMADDTGGKAFINTNGIAEAVQEVVDHGSNYYTLTYNPTDGNEHGEFRSIQVKLDDAKGYKLAYRRGYFAEPPETSPAKAPSFRTASAKIGPASVLHSSVQFAAEYLTPPSTQLGFYAHVEAAGEDADAGQARRRLPANGSREFIAEYSVDPRNLATTVSADGHRHAHVEFIAYAYDAQGRRTRSYVKSVQIIWTAQQFAAAMQHGVRYEQEVGLSAGGSSVLRLMVHDLSNDHLGSLDVPVSSLKSN